MKATVSAKAAFLAAVLQPGEIYAGIILGKADQPDHHLILLPGEAESVTWENAKKFAKKAGGELPTRREQSLLFANLKEEFKPNYYWSGEQHAEHSDFAWYQFFGDGHQRNDPTSRQLRARAVRRLIIQ